MRAITLFRAFAWFGVLVIFWSLNVTWGIEASAGEGPPNSRWERLVVGAACLGVIAALMLSVSGRKGNPPSWLMRGIAAAAALGIFAIVFYLRDQAKSFMHLTPFLDGAGFTWLMAGAGLVAGAVIGSLGLKPKKKHRGSKKSKRR